MDFVDDVEQVKAGYWPRHAVPCNDLTYEKREIFHIAISHKATDGPVDGLFADESHDAKCIKSDRCPLTEPGKHFSSLSTNLLFVSLC